MKKNVAYYGRTKDGELLAFDLATQGEKKGRPVWPYWLAGFSLLGILYGVFR